jgi:hypothetical protein
MTGANFKAVLRAYPYCNARAGNVDQTSMYAGLLLVVTVAAVAVVVSVVSESQREVDGLVVAVEGVVEGVAIDEDDEEGEEEEVLVDEVSVDIFFFLIPNNNFLPTISNVKSKP